MLTPDARVISLVANLVVVRHTQKIEPALDRTRQHLSRPGIAVRVQRVAMQVAAQPARLGCTGRPGRQFGRRGGEMWMCRSRLVAKGDGHLILAASWTNFVGAEQYLPLAGRGRAGQGRWCGPGL